jgi:hypothetical protein
MAIKLDWKDLSLKGYTGVNIYRNAGKFDMSQALPAPLVANLAANTVTYTDTTAVKNTSYSYLIAGVKDGKVTGGVPFTAGNYNDTGPGPTTLARGDWFCGYFGEVSSADLFTTGDIKTQIPTTAGMTLNTISTWYKFIYNGKIIFTPGISIGTVSWFAVYAAGLIYGTDDNGNVPSGANPNPTPKNQMARMTKGGWSFIFRAPKGVAAAVNSQVALWANTEVLEIFDRMYLNNPGTYGKGRFLDLPVVAGIYTNNWFANNVVAIMAPPSGLTSNVPTTAFNNWVPVLELEFL